MAQHCENLMQKPWWPWLFWIGMSLIAALILDGRPFATPDEARYVEIPREMLETGRFVVPHLNGFIYFEKPPLFYWIQACIMAIFGGGRVSNAY